MQDLVDTLLSDDRIAAHAVYRGVAPARVASFAEPASGWPPGARAALDALRVGRLYTHQAEALDLVAAGRNVLLATPTASGKTLAYLLALLAARARDPLAHALFIYPLKALARDQLAAIRRFLAPLGLEPEEAAEVYDGDTPENERRRIRRRPPAVVLTNPDMAHLALLPSHETWGGFLSRLALVVVDEAHVYRGIFGAHVHHVLRRLVRLARYHGGTPQILAGSATIGAPGEFIETLAGEPFAVLRESGAPASLRHVLFLAPHAESPYVLATRAVARAVSAGHKTIAFTKARRITELMHQWLVRMRPDLAPRVASYRSGYLPAERREIERRLFSGQLSGVISTSALEAGIDVGGLDVCVLVGYPGSLATSWQRIGRTGRQDRESLAVLVALPDALDRYVAAHPEHFFSGEFEKVVLDPRNDTVADAHLEAAAAERSIDDADVALLQREGGAARVERLVGSGRLVEVDGERRWFSLRRLVTRDIPLRSAGTPYKLQLAGGRATLGSMDESRAWFEAHPGAIYLHAGRTYRGLTLDRENHTITLEPCDVDYFTQVYARKETEILERCAERPLGPAKLAWGRLRVTTFIEGYSKRRIFGLEEISRHPLEAPPQVLETVGFWIELPVEVLPWLVEQDLHPAGALHAAEHASIGLFPLLAICDRWDLGGISYANHPQFDRPAVFIYDGWPGGVGLARTGYELAEELFARTRELIAGCACEDGCPGCVHSPKCGSGNNPLDKAGAVAVLDVVLGRRELACAGVPPEALEQALATHRTGVHAGVRGGGPLPPGFFAGSAGGEAATALIEAPPAEVTLESLGWPAALPLPRSLLSEQEGRWLFFDVETLRGADDVGGWNRIRDMGLALGVVLDARTSVFRTYHEDDVDELVDDLCEADRVVGFNLDRFDIAVLGGYAGRRVRKIRTLDLMTCVCGRMPFRLSLAHLCGETLGVQKSADGLQSLRWVREGRFDLIERYCRDDVLLTAALWAHGRSRGFVLFKNREGLRGRLPVSW
ncbi:MAG: DEAD/DEAH box helicase [Acidobacteria bacterium]|nr:DEAD/DEAH box helicase [Acidobacteriota bacterium]